MILFPLIIFFFFGLIIGSFLNVVIYRYNTSRNFGGRSACMSCKNTLAWYDLVPVFSFLFLGGRCRNCKTKISWQYPIVETITGFIFALLFWKFRVLFFYDIISFAVTYAYYIVVFALLLVISVYDLKHKIVPDMLALFLGILAFVGIFLFNDFGYLPHFPGVLAVFSGLLLALPFAFLWLISSGKWMGLGDAKLMVGIGYVLGIERGLSGIMIAFWSGAVIGILIMLIAKKGIKTEVPFAPFLALGALLSFVFSLHIFALGL